MRQSALIKDKGRLQSQPFYVFVCVVMLGLLILSALAAVTIGSMDLSIRDVYSVIGYELFHLDSLSAYARGAAHNVVWLIRFPRVVMGLAVGMGLSICGVVMQAIVKNPLAETYVLGISSGASLGATTALFFGLGAVLGGSGVGVCAFIGAFLISMLVVAVANIGGPANSVKLILSGMALGALCMAFSNFMVFMANDPNTTQQLTFWMLGSLSGAKWGPTLVIFVVVAASTLFFWSQHRPLNLMLLGDDVSITLGTNLNTYRHVYLVLTSLIIGLCVYASGTIGFIGLVVPHAVRMVFGTDHRKLVPLSALTGGIFLIWADVLARTLLPETEVPIGILVSMVGAPVFIYMMMRKSYGFGGGE